MRKPYPKRKCKSLPELFWPKVNKTETCWLWTACLDEHGYGQMNWSQKRWKASRLSWLIHYGAFDQSQYVLHSCDTPACVNPYHLFLGSQKQNGVDMKEKRRSSFGSHNGQSKLTESQVIEIKRELAVGKYGIQTILARRYGVGQDHISRISTGKVWSYLNVAPPTHP